MALQDGAAQESLEHLRRARAADWGLPARRSRLVLGDAYAALGHLAEAAAQYDSLTSSYGLEFVDAWSYGVLRPVAHERLGAVQLALGDTVAAIRNLAAFAQLWDAADPELQPRVESARRAVERLAADRGR